MPTQGTHVPCPDEKQTQGELLSLSPAFLAGVMFAKAAAARNPSFRLGRREVDKGFVGSFVTTVTVGKSLFPSATCFKVYFICACLESYLFHSGWSNK